MTKHHPREAGERESNGFVADPTVLRATAVVALLAIGAIHFVQIVPTIEQTPLLGVGYVALIAASVVVAARLAIANDARAWAAAGLLSASILVGYAFTRLVGTTFDNQDVGNWSCMLGLASIFVEGSVVALSVSARAFRTGILPSPRWSTSSTRPVTPIRYPVLERSYLGGPTAPDAQPCE